MLGDPGAPVTLVDVRRPPVHGLQGVRRRSHPRRDRLQGARREARIEFRNFTVISEESVPAAAAAIAAGKQGRGWNFVELFYRNQGIERSGYVTDEFLTEIARGAGVPDIAKWNADRESRRVLSEVSADTAEAEQLGLRGTPSFAVEGPGARGLEPLGTPGSADEIEAAIEAALG